MDVKRGKKEFADFDNAIEKAIAKNLKVAYSNDCFELWFYLHYEYTEQQHRRKFYYDSLSKKWNINYIKFGKTRKFCSEIYSLLENDDSASQHNAIQRAEKLLHQQKDLVYHEQNPVTTVHVLVEFLNENKRR